jgi:hypothetical protein
MEKRNMIKKYKAKVSYGLLTFIFLVFFAPLIPDLIKGGLNGKMIGVIGFLLLIFAIILHFFFNTKYTIESNKLKIKCGFISYKPIAIDKITEISRTRNIISSPAPSFDRIGIKYGEFDEIIISPKDKFGFSEYLTKLNPNIKNNITEK